MAAVSAVAQIDAVPMILEVLCYTTGMGFAAVACVTEERWVACGVRDEIELGLLPGDELNVETTLCHEVRHCRETIAIDEVASDPIFRDHHTPAMYGFQSYVSTPILLADGSIFGTLCAIDPKPRAVKNHATLAMFKLFAELISFHLESAKNLASSKASLLEERETSELREQFIAVLGHDLRSPLHAILGNTEVLTRLQTSEMSAQAVGRIERSGKRMSGLIDDVLDFARGRLGSGLALNVERHESVVDIVEEAIAEFRSSFPERVVLKEFDVHESVRCDRSRLGQLLSNLLANAGTHGDPQLPILVRASTGDGSFECSVANGGEPLSKTALDRLFQPFFRGEVQKSQQGLGLGLYIASEIARAHGGTLEVESSAEETRFTFRMPLS